ncbi:hypothetical protein SAY87_021269 [Trapa incisa]|uniref:Uncharacterized protein n=1 Tax=Trapa incisa TaxID=236973 RepID=A0AAN7JRW0_9MYRT|nr:hypothetical protein SAY87_021269 [Trapa incisa]
MAGPLLLKSTSSSTSQDMPRNQAPLAGPELAQARQTEVTPRPAGRGKRAAKPPALKRPPQRGLGVAQLERLRQQEQWKKMTEMSQHGQHLRAGAEYQFQAQVVDPAVLVPGPLCGAPVHYSPADYFTGSSPTVACSGQMLGAGRGPGGQTQRSSSFPYGVDRAVGGMYMAGAGASATPAFEPLRELSSIPNVRCVSDRCDVCSLKKKGNANAANIVMLDHGAGGHADSRERPLTNNRDFLALNLGNSFSCSGNHINSSEQNYALHGSRRPSIDQVKKSAPHSYGKR